MTLGYRRQASPVRGRKAAIVLATPALADAWFAGLSVDGGYRADDVAACVRGRCPVGREHDPPHPRGTCGFSASPADPLDLLTPELVVLDVELFGRVVRHERGWRASRQRVLEVEVVGGCQRCLAPVARPRLVALAAPSADPRLVVVPRCEECAEVVRWPRSATPLTRAGLAGLLQADVSFAAPDLSAAVLSAAAGRRAAYAA